MTYTIWWSMFNVVCRLKKVEGGKSWGAISREFDWHSVSWKLIQIVHFGLIELFAVENNCCFFSFYLVWPVCDSHNHILIFFVLFHCSAHDITVPIRTVLPWLSKEPFFLFFLFLFSSTYRYLVDLSNISLSKSNNNEKLLKQHEMGKFWPFLRCVFVSLGEVDREKWTIKYRTIFQMFSSFYSQSLLDGRRKME